jgi:L-rhamnose-H+ transport protein
MTNANFGLLLMLIGGIMTGSFSLPMKKTTRWSWEATWLIWSICALLIIPWAIAFATVPDVLQVFSKAETTDMLLVFAFGLCWGLGAVLFGQSIAMIGISLSFALCIGLVAAFGQLIPMFKTPEVFLTKEGILSTIGIAIMVVGVAICAIAGHFKEKQMKATAGEDPSVQEPASKPAGNMMLGLVLATLGGIFSSMLNFAFNFSGSIKEAALSLEASKTSASDPVWAITLLGGLTTNVVYCSFLLFRNKTWGDYKKTQTGSYWFLAALMGAIWMSSIALYGRAAVLMGDLGGSAGWGLYMGVVILISNAWGFVTGEWRGIHGRPIRLIIIGVVLLLIAICIIGYATTLSENSVA